MPVFGEEDAEEPGARLSLEGLALAPVDLESMPLEDEAALERALEAARGEEPQEASGSGEGAIASFGLVDEVASGLSAAAGAGITQALQIARKVASLGIHDPLGVLGVVMKSLLSGPTGRPKSMDDYGALLAAAPRHWIVDRHEEDEIFAWMRVGGFNPVVIQKARELSGDFPVTEAMYGAAMNDADDSMERALREGRLFMTDYAPLDGVVNGNFPNGPKFGHAPKALFAMPRGNGPRRLRPVAIQCGQDPRDYPIFTPGDGDLWQRAKVAVTCADANHHEVVSHLAKTHFLVEPFVLATHRRLSASHPVGKLLRPHFEGTMAINRSAWSNLIANGNKVDQVTAGKIESTRSLVPATLSAYEFNRGFLATDIEARGMTDPDLEYPYRDDAALIWGAIERWVRGYLEISYASDADVAGDPALSAWGRELSANDGGRVRGFGEDDAGKISSLEYLARATTMIIFTASAQHAAVNFPQADLMSYVPAVPGALYRPMPRSARESAKNPYLDMFPPMNMAMLQVETLLTLGGVHHTALGQYPSSYFGEKAVRERLSRFQEELRGVEATILARNEARLAPYPYLRPSLIPQSINI